MKRSRKCQIIAALIVALCCSLQALSAEKAVIRNDTVWRDTSGQEIWCNGGHMIREGDRFYWVGYETRPRTGFRNIKLYSSTNLADWRFDNNILRNEGPWSNLRVLATEPVSPDSFNTQHDFVIPVTGTQTTTYVYVGDRYSQHHGQGVGRSIFLPLVWDGGVPKLTWCSKWSIDTRTGRWETVAPVVNAGARASLRPTVEIEEDVYNYEPADNGAGPMWCHGSTCLVHIGDDLFASGLETIRRAKPLNNCRWMLFQRGPQDWRKVCFDASGRTREPSPLVGFVDGRLFLSANPTLNKDPNAYSGPAQPELLQFDVRDPSKPAKADFTSPRTTACSCSSTCRARTATAGPSPRIASWKSRLMDRLATRSGFLWRDHSSTS